MIFYGEKRQIITYDEQNKDVNFSTGGVTSKENSLAKTLVPKFTASPIVQSS